MRGPWRQQTDWQTLEAIALEARAGMAWACAYSSADEYEAAIINARRAAGAYDPGRQQRYAMMGIAAAVVALVGFCVWL